MMNRTVPIAVEPGVVNGAGTESRTESRVTVRPRATIQSVSIPGEYVEKFANVVPDFPEPLKKLCVSSGITIGKMDEEQADDMMRTLCSTLSMCEVSSLKHDICVRCKYVAPSGKVKGLSTSGSRKDLVPRILAWTKCFVLRVGKRGRDAAAGAAEGPAEGQGRTGEEMGKDENEGEVVKIGRKNADNGLKKTRRDVEIRVRQIEMENERHDLAIEKERTEIQRLRLSMLADTVRVRNELFTSLIGVEKMMREAGESSSAWMSWHKAALEREVNKLNNLMLEK